MFNENLKSGLLNTEIVKYGINKNQKCTEKSSADDTNVYGFDVAKREIRRIRASTVEQMQKAERDAELFRRRFVWRWTNDLMRCVCLDERRGYGYRIYEPREPINGLQSRIPAPMVIPAENATSSDNKKINLNACELIEQQENPESGRIFRLFREGLMHRQTPNESPFNNYYTIQITEKTGRTAILRCISSNVRIAKALTDILLRMDTSSTDADAMFEDLRTSLCNVCLFGAPDENEA